MKFWLGVVVLLSIWGGTAGLFVGSVDVLLTGSWNISASSAGFIWAGSLLGKYVETIKD